MKKRPLRGERRENSGASSPIRLINFIPIY
jgi:hypothetical protein